MTAPAPPPPPALPPLYALRAFECVARTGSVTLAGQTLHVTQSTISKHLKTLETHFGCKLLLRTGPRLALTPQGDDGPLNALAAQVVEGLDPFRAPLTEAEMARRNPDRLTPRQRALLDAWGYPYVLDEFRFHMTLTGALDPATLDAVTAQLGPRLTVVPRPFTLDAISLMGEDAAGRVHLIRRLAL